jgi:hypothetical protein
VKVFRYVLGWSYVLIGCEAFVVLGRVKPTKLLDVIRWGGDDWNLSKCFLFLSFMGLRVGLISSTLILYTLFLSPVQLFTRAGQGRKEEIRARSHANNILSPFHIFHRAYITAVQWLHAHCEFGWERQTETGKGLEASTSTAPKSSFMYYLLFRE